MTLTNNAQDSRTVASGGGAFTFAAQSAGSNWNVAVTPPSGQVCYLTNQSGSNIAANVSNVAVSCVTTTGTQTLSGTVGGLNGTLTLLNNRGNPLTISSNGAFSFSSGLSPLSTYEITVGTPPTGQSCSIFNASGTMISINYDPSPDSKNVTNINVNCVTPQAYTGTILLGAPTSNSIVAKLFSADQNGAVSISYGTTQGSYPTTTALAPLFAGTPATIKLTGLAANTKYYYLLNYQTVDGAKSQSAEYSFRTARPSGSTFSFAIQADSHLDENTDAPLYQQTLRNIVSDSPDFLVDLGDTFMTEKHNQALDPTPQSGSNTNTGSPPASTEQQVIARYRMDLKYFDIATRTVPLFLANGNHDAELGWIWNGTNAGKNGLSADLASWAANARYNYYVNPDPSTISFYSGQSVTKENIATTPTIPARNPAAWYSWVWGDALFIVLDPYWNSSSSSGWNMSLGLDQYNWLTSTLANSTAKFKFIFLHNLVGGSSSMRGGAEVSQLFEWGGYDATLTGNGSSSSPNAFTIGSNLFSSKRPGWAKPIHDLLRDYKVTAVFHGHDHFYGQQMRDGIIYQEVPQPSAQNTTNGASTATAYGYPTSGTYNTIVDSSTGHLRITVSSTSVKSEYVRAWLPAGTVGSKNTEDGSSKINKQISKTWTCNYNSSTGLCVLQ